jgi:hypothetical protein
MFPGATTTNSPAASSSACSLQRLIQVLDLGLQRGARKSEKHDAGVRKSLMEDQLAEIAVSNDQDPLLLPCELKNVLIRKTRRVVA